MKQSNRLDAVCIGRILKYIQTINEAYAMFNIKSAYDLEDNNICQLAITQAITNIYQLRDKIQDETLSKLPMFSNLRLSLRAARNIASHDYDSLDFGAIYSITNKLRSHNMSYELEVVKNDIEQSCTGD